MITSTSNYLVKAATSLHQKKGRQEQGLFLAEGIHLVQEALRAKAEIRHFFWSAKLLLSDDGRKLLAALNESYQGYEVNEAVLAKLAETENPQGILAVVAIPPVVDLDLSGTKLGLILDRLQDPGNLGTIIRTAWAVGVDCLLLTAGTADPYQGKVVRASQGGVFFQRIYQQLEPELITTSAAKAGIQLVAGDSQAAEVCFECDLEPPTLLLLGNEGQGLGAEWYKYPLKRVNIPQPGQAESLNVSIAAAILLYEVVRQRFYKNTCKN